MPTVSAHPRESEEKPVSPVAAASSEPSAWIGWSSFFFALLQSVCSFFAAIDGLRLAIGLGALAVSAGVGATLDGLHTDWIRLPMLALALFGSLLNLVVLWQIRRLRSNPAAQWRQKQVGPRKMRMEWVQLVLSLVTLVLIAAEEYWHLRTQHHI